jgi:phosphate starvation-inducible protein PhoH
MSKNARRFTRRRKKEVGETPTPKYSKTITLTAQTYNQKIYARALNEDPLIFVTGCAGTGKTYMAATQAAKMYYEGKISKIVVTRPNVAAGGRDIGYFKGGLKEKMTPWVAPLMDVLSKHLGKIKVEKMLEDGNIVVEPFSVMRGKSFDDACIAIPVRGFVHDHALPTRGRWPTLYVHPICVRMASNDDLYPIPRIIWNRGRIKWHNK